MATTKTGTISYSAFAWYNGGWVDWKTSATNGYIGYNAKLSPYYTVSCIRFKTPSFVGTSKNLTVKLKVRCSAYTSVQVYVSLSTSTPNGGTVYVGSSPGTDAGRVYSKIHTISGLSSTEAYKTISMDCTKLKSNTTYFLYISATTQQRLAEICSASSSTVSGTLTYELPEYAVTYNANEQGGTVSNLPSNQTKTYGTAFTLSSTVPTHTVVSTDTNFNVTCNGNGGKSKTVVATKTVKETRVFKGWNTKADGTGTAYAAGAAYNANAALTLYAQWTVTTTTSYSNNKPGTTTRDDDVETYVQTLNVGNEYAAIETNKLESKRTTKYTFKGWNTKANGTGTDISTTTGFTAAYTIYAQWESSTTYESVTMPDGYYPSQSFPVTVSLDAAGGTIDGEDAATIYGARTQNYCLTAWMNDDDYNTIFVGDTITPTSSGSWTAMWGPAGATANVVELPTPVRPGYIFAGWVDSETGNVINSSSYKPTYDDALTATWAAHGGARISVDDTSAGLYLPFIYTDGEFKQCLPYIYTDGAWHLCGG